MREGTDKGCVMGVVIGASLIAAWSVALFGAEWAAEQVVKPEEIPYVHEEMPQEAIVEEIPIAVEPVPLPAEALFIREVNPDLTEEEALAIHDLIMQTIERYRANSAYKGGVTEQVTPRVVLSLIATESRFDNSKVGSAGEIGFCQVHPKWHLRSLAKAGILRRASKQELARPEANIKAGTFILMNYAVNSSSLREALAKYNAGPSRVGAGMPYARRVLRGTRRIRGS